MLRPLRLTDSAFDRSFTNCIATLRLRKLALLAGVIAILLLISPWKPQDATAADVGPGYSQDGSSAMFVGAMRFNGMNVYCLELDQPSPIGHQTRVAGAQDHIPADIAQLPAETRAKLHWAIANLGASTNPDATAAVAMYVWSIADAEHYRGDPHYLSLLPADRRSTVAGHVETLRQQANDVRVVAAPKSFGLTMRTEPGAITVELTDIPGGTEVVLQVTGGEIDGKKEITVPATSATTMRVHATPNVGRVAITAQMRPAPGFATATPQYLITEGRQLLLQPSNEAWPTAGAEVKLNYGIRHTPGTVTPMPSMTPPSTPVPAPTPSPSPEPEPEPTPEPEPEPKPEPEPEPEPSATPAATPTPAPAPTATYSFASDEPEAPKSTTTATHPVGHLPSESKAPEASTDLAETGLQVGPMMLIGGSAMTLLGAGGWLISRQRHRPISGTGSDIRGADNGW